MQAAARRAASGAAGHRVEPRGEQRLSRRAWQENRRACRLANEYSRVRAVNVHGVHISFQASPPSCQHVVGIQAQPAPSASSPPAQERAQRPPNVRQRRSAKRLERIHDGKKAAAAAAGSPAAAANSCDEGLGDTKVDSTNDESMDVEALASPRREQQQIFEEASEALAER